MPTELDQPTTEPNRSPAAPSRQDRIKRDVLALVIFAALALLHEYRAVLDGEKLRWRDNAEVYEPWHAYYVGSLRAGRLPLWCPILGIGFPLLGESEQAVFHPLNLLTFSCFDAREGDVAQGVLRLFLAAAFTYAAARAIGLQFWGGLLAGVVFAFSGFVIMHWPALSSHWSLVEIPLMVLAAERLVTRRRAWTVIWASVVFAVALLAGHFQHQFMTILMFWWYGFGRALQVGGGARRLFGQALRLLLPVGLGFALAAVQLLPTWEMKALSARQGPAVYEPPFKFPPNYGVWPSPELRPIESEQAKVLYQSMFSFPPHHVTTYVFPHLWPEPGAYDPFWTALPVSFGYVSLVPLALLPLALDRRRRRAAAVPLASGALVFTLLSFGPWLPGYGLLAKLPGFRYFAFSGRYTLPASMCLALLGGLGLDATAHVTRQDIRRWAWRISRLFFIVAVFALVASVGELLWLHVGPKVPDIAGMLGRTAVRMARSVPVMAISALVFWLLLRRWRAAQGLAVAITALDLMIFAWQFRGPEISHPTSLNRMDAPGPVLGALPPAHTIDLRHVGGPHSGRAIAGHRVLWFKMPFMPERCFWVNDLNHRPYDEVAHILRALHVGYVLCREPIGDPRLHEIYAGSDPQITRLHGPRSRNWYLYECLDVLPRAFLVDRAVWSSDGEEARGRVEDPTFDAAALVVLEGTPPDAPASAAIADQTPPGSVRIEEEGERLVRLQVEARRPAWLVLSDLYYPGWRAFVEGTEVPMHQANYVCRAVHVPAGRHVVEFAYRPASWRWGQRVSLATLGCIVAASIVLAVRRARTRSGASEASQSP